SLGACGQLRWSHVRRLYRLHLVVESVGGGGGHEGDGDEKLAGFAIVEPGVAGLPFGFELARALGKPVTVVSRDLSQLGIEAAQLPISALLLQNKRHRVSAPRRRRIQSHDPIIPRRQIGDDKNRAVSSLPLRSENAA